MTFEEAYNAHTACPVKQACCVPADEEPVFDDCCDIRSSCCGDECMSALRIHPYAQAAYYFCEHTDEECCPPADGG